MTQSTKIHISVIQSSFFVNGLKLFAGDLQISRKKKLANSLCKQKRNNWRSFRTRDIIRLSFFLSNQISGYIASHFVSLR